MNEIHPVDVSKEASEEHGYDSVREKMTEQRTSRRSCVRPRNMEIRCRDTSYVVIDLCLYTIN